MEGWPAHVPPGDDLSPNHYREMAVSVPFVSIQIGPESLIDEGVEHVLDDIKHRASCNAALISTHSFAHGTIARPPDAIHPGHGKRVAPGERWLGGAYIPVDPQYYRFTRLQPQRPAEAEAREIDVLDACLGPARDRGIRVYARIAENAVNNTAIPQVVPGYVHALAIDHTGRRTSSPCLNNADYKGWYLGIVEELVKRYPAIEGICIGMEGRGPLHFTITQGAAGRCFCAVCAQIARDRDVSAERARAGFAALAGFAKQALQGRPRDGYFVEFFKLLLRHSEVLAWEQLYYDAKANLRRELYGAIKAIDRTKLVGWHLWHTITFDPLLRAAETFDEMPEYADWIKPAIYHNSGGARAKSHLQSLQRTVFGDLSERGALEVFRLALGYPELPAWEELEHGLPASYVETETRRVVQAVQDAIPVYPGIDVDVPVGRGIESDYHRSEPDDVYAAVRAAFAGGAQGIVISRKYSEARLENLDAVGAAVRSLQ
jgi:hypothetical protein